MSRTILLLTFVLIYQGATFLKGIFLDSTPEKVQHLNAKSFSNMNNLRLLKINNVDLPQGLHDFSSELCFIHWDGYPLKSMPTSFNLDKLVELNMPYGLGCPRVGLGWVCAQPETDPKESGFGKSHPPPTVEVNGSVRVKLQRVAGESVGIWVLRKRWENSRKRWENSRSSENLIGIYEISPDPVKI